MMKLTLYCMAFICAIFNSTISYSSEISVLKVFLEEEFAKLQAAGDSDLHSEENLSADFVLSSYSFSVQAGVGFEAPGFGDVVLYPEVEFTWE